MKRFVLAILCLFIILIPCTAFASEAAFYTITYHNNYGDYESTQIQTKQPGKTVEIEDSHWRYEGNVFSGWALSPDAAEADYLPGDLYKTDQDIDLYAVWKEPYDMGTVTSGTKLTIPAFPVKNEWSYMQFQVAESGFYRFESVGGSLKNCTSSSGINILSQSSYGYWNSISSGDYIYGNEYWLHDFTISAKLEAGVTYLLEVIAGPDPIELEIDSDLTFITYHNNYGSYSSVQYQSVEHGAAAVIEDAHWRQEGCIFAGWALSPSAAEADYLPGDKYTSDANIDLYAVWDAPYDLGTISSGMNITVPAFTVPNEWVYLQFEVENSGHLSIESINGSLKNCRSSSGIDILSQSDYGYWNSIAYGEYIYGEEDYWLYDFKISANLEAGKTYLLEFIVGPDPINLKMSGDISFITYHNNYGNYEMTQTQEKKNGKKAVIEDSHWHYEAHNFAGWATSPDAVAADYLPGDAYTLDANLDLYAVWQIPYNLGRIISAETFVIPAAPVKNEWTYIQFSVAKTGAYNFKSINGSLKNCTSSSGINILDQSEYGNWNSIASGEYIYGSDYWLKDFTITARLQKDVVYLLEFITGPDPVNLKCQPQYDINPYKADIALPIGLEVVRSMAFAECAFESIHLNEAVEVIEENAFYNCSSLEKVIFSTKNAVIDENAFSGCGAFTVVAPEGSTAQAFAQANGLTFEVIQE